MWQIFCFSSLQAPVGNSLKITVLSKCCYQDVENVSAAGLFSAFLPLDMHMSPTGDSQFLLDGCVCPPGLTPDLSRLYFCLSPSDCGHGLQASTWPWTSPCISSPVPLLYTGATSPAAQSYFKLFPGDASHVSDPCEWFAVSPLAGFFPSPQLLGSPEVASNAFPSFRTCYPSLFRQMGIRQQLANELK